MIRLLGRQVRILLLGSDRPERHFAASAGSDAPAGSDAGYSARFQDLLFRQDLLLRQDLLYKQDLLFEQKFLLKQILFLTYKLIVLSNFGLNIKSVFSVTPIPLYRG